MRGILHVPVPAVFMAFVATRSLMTRPVPALAVLLLSLWLAGCSSSTTVSEWSCPTDQPDGCFSVAEGDAMALEALRGAGTAGSDVTVRRTITPADGKPSRVSLPTPISTGGEPDILYDADDWPVKVDDGDEAVTAGANPAAAMNGRRDSPLGGFSGDGDIPPPDPSQPDQGPVDLTLFAEGARTGTADTPHADAPASVTPGRITADRIIEAFADTPPPDFIPGAASGSLPSPDMVRVPEELAEVWIGPFEDAAGNWHPAGRMFIIVTPARWRRP